MEKLKNCIEKLNKSGVIFFVFMLLLSLFGIVDAEAMCADVIGVQEEGVLTHQQLVEDTDLLEIDYGKSVKDIGRDVFLLTTMTDEIGNKRTCSSVETGVMEYSEMEYIDSVSANVPGANLVNGQLPNTFTVNNISIWSKGDTMLIPSVNGSEGKPLLLRVMDVSGTTLTAKVMNPTVTGGVESFNTIPANSEIQKLGKAIDELTGKVDSKILLPSPHTNYCQTFMETVLASWRQLNVRKKVHISFDSYLEQQIRAYKKSRELSRLIGVKSMRYDENNREIYTAAGAFNLAQNAYAVTAWDNQNYISMARACFETGNANGSNAKILLCGADFLQGMTNVESYQKSFNAAETEVVFGIKIKRVETDFGIFYPKYHRLLTGSYSNKAIALDMPYVRIDSLTGEEFQTKELKDNDDQRVKGVTLWESSCVVLENEMAHCVITGA